MKTYASETSLDNAVIYFPNQHHGRDNAIARRELVRLVYGDEAAENQDNNNMEDRHTRESIERWREKGMHICNMGNGYFMAATRDEYEAFKKFYLGASFRKFDIIGGMDKAADEKWGRSPKSTPAGQGKLFG
jgi:hypothetical protein